MNKIILVLLVISLSIFALFIFNESGEVKSVYSRPAPPEGYGDINGDGVVSYDVNDAHKHDFWLLYAFEDEYGPWDVNEDGITNGDDVQEIQKFWTGAVNYSHLRADINWDDRVDVMDIWYVLKFFNETKTEPMSQERIDQITSHLNVTMLSPQEIMYRGDVDADGILTEYDVYLIIQYAKGAIDEFPVEATNMPPVAQLDKATYDTVAYKEVTFDGSGSYDPDGEIVGYRWIISNSSGIIVDTGFIDSPTFSYTFPYPPSGKLSASYSLSLYVKDDDGATAVANAEIIVFRGSNIPPVAILSQHEHHINFGDTVTFDASQSYDPEGLPIKFNWYINMQPVYDDFGDYPTFTYTFDDPNIFDKAVVSVKVKDLAGDTGYDHAVVYINRTVYLNLTWQPEKPVVGDTVYFDASGSYVENATITGYSFLIDNEHSSGRRATPYYKYTFYSYGEHTVMLTVWINDAIPVSRVWNITVYSPYTVPSIIIEGDKYVGKTLSITVFYPYDAINRINIDFGDGHITSSPAFINANQYTFTHSYDRAGIYLIKANIVTMSGDYVNLTKTIEIKEESGDSIIIYIVIASLAILSLAVVYDRIKRRRK